MTTLKGHQHLELPNEPFEVNLSFLTIDVSSVNQTPPITGNGVAVVHNMRGVGLLRTVMGGMVGMASA